MRRIVIALASTLTGLVLLFSWPTSLNRTVASASEPVTSEPSTTPGTDDATGSTTEEATPATPDASDSSGSSGSSSATPSESPSATANTQEQTGGQTYTGAPAMTRYGNVTVQITVTDGVLTDAQAIEYPNRDHHDQRINAYAIPVLNSAAIEAGSADIAMVSGATYTSVGYIDSLQDALDQAGL